VEPTQELADDLYRSKVRRARQTPFAEKLLSGADLFEEVYQRMAMGVRLQYPDADDTTVLDLIRRRLDRLRRIEERS
jgi:hypothetical protein